MSAGFSSPNYTQTPNDLFETLMRQMSDCELRVVLVAVRKTLGYHKTHEAISLTQFMEMTGLSKQGVIDGLEAALTRGVLRELAKRGRRGVKLYELVIETDQSTILTSEGNDQSTILTSQTPDPSSTLTSTSQRSRHTKETLKENKPLKKKAAASAAAAAAASEELPARPTIFAYYEGLLGTLSGGLIIDTLKDAAATWPDEWLRDAFLEAAKYNGRSWAYVEKILFRWQREGKNVPSPSTAAAQSNGRSRPAKTPAHHKPAEARPAGTPDFISQLASGDLDEDTPVLMPRGLNHAKTP